MPHVAGSRRKNRRRVINNRICVMIKDGNDINYNRLNLYIYRYTLSVVFIEQRSID